MRDCELSIYAVSPVLLLGGPKLISRSIQSIYVAQKRPKQMQPNQNKCPPKKEFDIQ
jgi:hypothetical protein